MLEQIGTTAGKVWNRLDKGSLSNTNLQKVRKECNLKTQDFLLALGWLARENKIKFLNDSSNIYVFPNE